MLSLGSLKHCGMMVRSSCRHCSQVFTKKFENIPHYHCNDLGSLVRFLYSFQRPANGCSSCKTGVRTLLPAPGIKPLLIDESMAGILGSHHSHGTLQVRCFQRDTKTPRFASISPGATLASPNDKSLKDILGSLMTTSAGQAAWQDGCYPSTNREMTTDLKRFLSEVGTDPREARYWLKQFRNLKASQPFAVIQVGLDVFGDAHLLENLVSCISFLQRNQMRPVVIHGNAISPHDVIGPDALRTTRSKLLGECIQLTSMLEAYGTQARPLFSGCTLIQAEQHRSDSLTGVASTINIDPIKWCLQTKHVPIIPAVGETSGGQIIALDIWSVTEAVSKLLQPLKVMKINTVGGFVDEENHVIANINLPTDMTVLSEKPWCSPEKLNQIKKISSLLDEMPSQSSVVLTSVDKMLQELFTHHGSGTFFKITEPILKFDSLKDVDEKRFKELLYLSFGREVKDDYMQKIKHKFHTLYLSQEYNAAALITKEPVNIPYLDKFAVPLKAQGEGTGEMVWECVRKDFGQLFWRSRGDNAINPWYFKKSEASWSNGKWTVFWYGVPQHHLSSDIIEHALDIENSFTS